MNRRGYALRALLVVGLVALPADAWADPQSQCAGDLDFMLLILGYLAAPVYGCFALGMGAWAVVASVRRPRALPLQRPVAVISAAVGAGFFALALAVAGSCPASVGLVFGPPLLLPAALHSWLGVTLWRWARAKVGRPDAPAPPKEPLLLWATLRAGGVRGLWHRLVALAERDHQRRHEPWRNDAEQ